jgi:hypothetical protein
MAAKASKPMPADTAVQMSGAESANNTTVTSTAPMRNHQMRSPAEKSRFLLIDSAGMTHSHDVS